MSGRNTELTEDQRNALTELCRDCYWRRFPDTAASAQGALSREQYALRFCRESDTVVTAAGRPLRDYILPKERTAAPAGARQGYRNCMPCQGYNADLQYGVQVDDDGVIHRGWLDEEWDEDWHRGANYATGEYDCMCNLDNQTPTNNLSVVLYFSTESQQTRRETYATKNGAEPHCGLEVGTARVYAKFGEDAEWDATLSALDAFKAEWLRACANGKIPEGAKVKLFVNYEEQGLGWRHVQAAKASGIFTVCRHVNSGELDGLIEALFGVEE